ncbi:MAG: hypothetical protein ACHP8B_10710 [Terriglobales bacterium]
MYGKLKVTGALVVVNGPFISLGSPNLHDIPTEVFTLAGVYPNCGSIQQSETFHHSAQVAKGDVVTKTSALQTGSSQTTSITGKINLDPIDIGATQALMISTQTTYTKADADNNTHTETESIDLPLQVPALTEETISHTFVVYHVKVPFSGKITVDGQLESNLAGLNMLSQVIPNESDRTFNFAGVVDDSTLVEPITKVTERKLTIGTSPCDNQPK